MSLFPGRSQTITARFLTNFPVSVVGDGGITVTKANGRWTVANDWSTLDDIDSGSITNSFYLITQNPDTLEFYRTDLSAVQASGEAGPGFTLKFTADLSGTTDTDPGSGKIRFNHATQGASTVWYVDDLDTSGLDVAATIATFDDSSATVKGQLSLAKVGDASARILAELDSLTDASGYTKLTVTILTDAGANPFVEGDEVALGFVRTGDSGSGDVSAGANITDHALVRGDGGVKDVQDTGIIVDDSDNVSGVGTLATTGKITVAIDDATNSGVTVAQTLKHTTSGSPAAGIGVSQNFEIETSADNNEVGMEIQAVVEDATAGSEDIGFRLKLMAAGAAVAEMVKVTSVGVMTLAGSAAKVVLTAVGGINLTGGFSQTSYDIGTPAAASTVTLSGLNGQIQHLSNDDAFTLDPPVAPTSIILQIVNTSTPGAITTSNFTVVEGDTFNTGSGKAFRCIVVKTKDYSTLTIKALN